MTTLNISIPESLADFVRQEAQRRGFATSDDYLAALIRQDEQRIAKAQLESKLLEGVNSESIEMTPAKWQQLRNDFERRHADDLSK